MIDYINLIYARPLIFSFNLLFALTGFIVVLVSTIAFVEFKAYEAFIGDDAGWATILIAIGAVVILVALLCCYSALRKKSNLILAFLIILVGIFLFEIRTAVNISNGKDDFRNVLNYSFHEMIGDYETHKQSWDYLQTQMTCCGILGPNDWNNTNLPFSCCLNIITPNCTTENAVKLGCMPLLLQYVEKLTTILAGVGFGIGWIQLVLIGYACCLYNAFQKDYSQFTETLI